MESPSRILSGICEPVVVANESGRPVLLWKTLWKTFLLWFLLTTLPNLIRPLLEAVRNGEAVITREGLFATLGSGLSVSLGVTLAILILSWKDVLYRNARR